MSSTVIGVRISSELHEMIENICRNRGEQPSDFVRRAILKELAELGFLPEEQRKALGLGCGSLPGSRGPTE